MSRTCDSFLDGRLQIAQPANGYRAGADPVLLAAAVPAEGGQRVLDLGCGAGVATLCLLARVPGVTATGIELDGDTADLARENLNRNGFSARILKADVADLPSEIRSESFDHVMMNPPFFERSTGSSATDPGREAGRGENVPLSIWIDQAIRRLSPTGSLTVVQRVERLPECLSLLDGRVGDITVLPFAPRHGRAAKLFILQAKKGRKGAFRLAPPFVLHRGERHESDGESYTPAAQNILRNGAFLSF